MKTLPCLVLAFGFLSAPFNPSAGQTVAALDAGSFLGRPSEQAAIQLPFGAKISGTVFGDVNKNGVRETGEPGLAGWKLYLSGIHSDSVLSDSGGHYIFGTLTPGSYSVREQVQPGWTQTAPGPPGSYSVLIVPADTSNHTGNDFGNHLPLLVAESYIGDDGTGRLTGTGGVWHFDTLSTAQRNTPLNCENTIRTGAGEMLTMQGWTPDSASTVSPQIRNFEATYGVSPQPDVGGGVLTFFQNGGGYAPHQRSVALSPVIDLVALGVTSFDQLELVFDYFADAGSDSLRLVVTTRFFAGSWRDTTDDLSTPSMGGENTKKVPLPVPKNATKVQVGVGVQNNTANTQPAKGPAVDKAAVKAKADEPIKYKYVPDISQDDSNWCQPSAFANCLIWWSQHGYDTIAPKTGTQAEKNTAVQLALVESCLTKGRHDVGVVDFLNAKGVYKGKKSQVPKPLEMVRKMNRDLKKEAKWRFLKEQFSAGNDVVLRVQWYNKKDALLGSNAAHYVTMAALKDSANKKAIWVANPWGVSHHTVDSSNRDEAYIKLDVALNADSTVRLYDQDLVKNAEGIDSASYCCVQDICVIRPYTPKQNAQLARAGFHSSASTSALTADSTTYSYTFSNDGPGAVNFVVITLEVPYRSVQSPPGWNWTPLPVQYPGFEGLCSFTIASQGIAWYTSSNPVPAGDSLSGFMFTTSSLYPNSDDGLVTYTESDSADGVFRLAGGPAFRVATVSYAVSDGWNLVSVPVSASDQSKSKLFPTAISPAFTYQGSYVVHSVLANGVGYWLKFQGAQAVTVTGMPVRRDSIAVTKGWNMIGSIDSSVAVTAVTSNPGGITTSPFFGYAGSYFVTDSIRPGKAYWVRTGAAGQLIISASGTASPAARIRIVPGPDLPPPPPGETGANKTAGIPGEFALHQNYPNPFNPATVIRYDLAEDSKVVLKIFNVYGQLVRTLVDGIESAGYKSVGLATGNLASGVYFYRLQAGKFADVKKMLLTK